MEKTKTYAPCGSKHRPTTVRFSDSDLELIAKLQARTGESRMALLRMGLKELEHRYKLDAAP
jgi:hypothetical protein